MRSLHHLAASVVSPTIAAAQEAMAAPDVAAATTRIKACVQDTCGVERTVPGSGAS